MKIFKRKVFLLLIFSFLLGIALPQSFSLGKDSSSKELKASFMDQEWDGRKVPVSGRCRQCGGKGMSPALLVSNIPENANKLLIEFNDASYAPLSYDGGHGAIWVDPKGKTEVTIQSILEETMDLPEGVFLEHKHRAPIGNSGAFFGPCGCGMGNSYFAVISAFRVTPDKKKILLTKTTIELGTF